MSQMFDSIRTKVQSDCEILLWRALANKSVFAFGDDGLGKHGRCDLAQTYKIQRFSIEIDLAEKPPTPIGIPVYDAFGKLSIDLQGYSASEFGHICTDQNFLISVRKLLEAQHIDPACMQYAAIDEQTENSVVMDFDPVMLLNW